MKYSFIVLILHLFALSGCGSIVVISETQPADINNNNQTENLCEGCLVEPKSGLNRDRRKGFYFDRTNGECKEFIYSTGPGCVPPPFKSIEECKSCCGGK